jgi:phasin family protein
MITVEQIVNTQKTNIDTFFGLTGKAFEGVEKLIELNISAAKSAIAEAAQNTKLVLSAKDPQELVALQSSLMQPAAEKAAAYGRHLYDIAASTNADIGKVAEAQAAEAQQKFMTVVDTAVKNAPAGTENVVALFKSAVATTSNAYESLQKAAGQAAKVAEANIEAISASAVKAASAPKTKRAAA